jgi:alpha-ketoglutarate-dependent taurine dioxygenase
VSVATDEFTSVVQLDVGAQDGWWAAESGAIRAALTQHFGAEIPGEALPQPDNPAALRAQLRAAAPTLAALTDRVRAAFDGAARACAVLVPRLGLAGVPVDEQRKGVYAVAALLGDVTANIPFEQALWDVRARQESTRNTSFSENDREADYHTDSGNLRVPERFFMLYAVRAASCGGGQSILRDGRTVKAQLARTDAGRQALRVLTETTLPTRIPKAFRGQSWADADGYQYAPVLAEQPLWRWRKDKLYKGLEKYPSYDTPEIRGALDTVSELLEKGADEIYQVLPTDGLLVVNNHVALHGRTAFTDPERHLFRIRMHDAPA